VTERTFEEIAKAMNITNGGAQFLYNNAIRKLKRKGIDLEAMKTMADELERHRANENAVHIPPKRGGRPR